MSELSFNDLPLAVNQIQEELIHIKHLLINISNLDNVSQDKWLNINDLCKYLPGNPAKPTIYSKLWKREIPGHKKGKNWFFLKSEIDQYLKSGRIKTKSEIEENSISYLKFKNGRK